jgi:hypothetical protein
LIKEYLTCRPKVRRSGLQHDNDCSMRLY